MTVLAKPAETARRSNMISIAGVELEMLERGHGAPLLYLHGGAGFALDAPFIDLSLIIVERLRGNPQG